MTDPTTIFLVLIPLSGVFGIFFGLKDRRGSVPFLANRSLVRGFFMVGWGAIVLLLFKSNILSAWISLLVTGLFFVIQEYVVAGIERLGNKKRAVGLRTDTVSEKDGLERWQQVKKKGLARFVVINAVLYTVAGVLLCSLMAIFMPGQLPLSFAVVIVLALALGGVTAAIRQWNWQKRNEHSLEQKDKSPVKD